jgi:hypothetical protein
MMEQGVEVVPGHPRGFRILSKKWTFVFFLIIVGSLIFFAFADNPVTGNLIKKTPTNESGNFKITATLGELSNQINIKQRVGEISIDIVGSNSKLYVGREGLVDLTELETATIVLQDFDGTLVFDGRKITSLKGDVSKITVNDLPTSSSGSNIGLKIDQEISYSSIELKDFYLKSHEFHSSGNVKVNDGKISLELDNETFLVEGFFGSLKSGIIQDYGITRNGVSFSGSVENAEVVGSFNLNLFKQ